MVARRADSHATSIMKLTGGEVAPVLVAAANAGTRLGAAGFGRDGDRACGEGGG